MPKTSFRQADIERIIRAARKTDCFVEVDLRMMTMKIVPRVGLLNADSDDSFSTLAHDGAENWDAN